MRIGFIAHNNERKLVSFRENGASVSELKSDFDIYGLTSKELMSSFAREVISESSYKRQAPISPNKIVAIGLNYMDHIQESGVEAPSKPLIFSKFPSTVIGDGEVIALPTKIAERVDWEVELAVVIGSTLKNVSMEDALKGVFGYTIANDVSARDIQFSDGQWIRGKNFDTFCPLGPEIVTADEIKDPQNLAISTKINGEVVQNSNTSKMLFPISELISFCSEAFTLYPGDVIITGTPWGCGEFATPRRSLRDGDVIEMEIEGIGILRNSVRSHRNKN